MGFFSDVDWMTGEYETKGDRRARRAARTQEDLQREQWDMWTSLFQGPLGAWGGAYEDILSGGAGGYTPKWLQAERKAGERDIRNFMDTLRPKMTNRFSTRNVPYSSMADKAGVDLAEIESNLFGDLAMRDYNRRYGLWAQAALRPPVGNVPQTAQIMSPESWKPTGNLKDELFGGAGLGLDIASLFLM